MWNAVSTLVPSLAEHSKNGMCMLLANALPFSVEMNLSNLMRTMTVSDEG
jgi:hypothetical protein